MIISDVMDEIGVRLEEIPELRVHPWAATRIAPPGVLISLPPNVTYNLTYGNRKSMTKVTLLISVLVGTSTDRTSRDAITKYMDSVGTYSVREKLQTSSYTTCGAVLVTSCSSAFVKIGDQKLLGAIFQADAHGIGV